MTRGVSFTNQAVYLPAMVKMAGKQITRAGDGYSHGAMNSFIFRSVRTPPEEAKSDIAAAPGRDRLSPPESAGKFATRTWLKILGPASN